LPKNLLVFFLQYGVGQLLARIFLFSPFILGVIFFSGTSPTLWLLPAFLLAGLIINICFTFALSCLTFKFRDAYAFVIIKDTLAWMLSGALIPLDLFPLVFQRVFQFLPFQYVAFMPTQVALGIFNWRSFIPLLIVLISMILIANILWLRLSKSNQGYSNHD
jgi:ABC-2 type transport system permease protein